MQRTSDVKHNFPFCWDRKPPSGDTIKSVKLNRSLEVNPANPAESVPVAENIVETIKTEAEPSDAVVRPHRVVDLINQGGDSGSSPCPRDTPEPVSGTPTKTNNDSELDSSNDHPNKKYNNTSLPAKKRKLFDQSDSSMPHSPLSISPTNMKNKPDKQSVLDAIVKTSGSEQVFLLVQFHIF